MLLAYDGTNYGGWQNQPNSVSIQSLLEKALLTLHKEKIIVTGSGRTDAGVHALGQVAHFTLPVEANLYKLKHSINGLIPQDIRVVSIEETFPNFHARFDATGKIYHYHLHLDRVLNPFTRLYSWHVPQRITVSNLARGAKEFIGKKDFIAFANEAHKGAAAKNSIRTLKRLDVIEQSGGIRLEFEGDGFLYKMVRNITGTLVDIGAGLLDTSEIEEIFLSKNRKKAGHTAPPQGLFLVKVHYPGENQY